MILLLLLSVFLHQLSSSTISEHVSFSFPSFDSESCSTGTLICSGSVTPYSGFLSLTSEPVPACNSTTPPSLPLNKVGRVLYNRPVLAWPATISTTFTFRISPYLNSLDSADGMTFIFAPDSKPSPTSSSGSNLGIIDPASDNARQLAVKLDTYRNTFDIDGNHIGIDTNSTVKSLVAMSLNSTGIDLKSGNLIKVQIDYNGWEKTLLVSVAHVGCPLKRFLEKSIIMSETVPSSVYVGFTAATGDFSESHQVLDWSFTTIPLPSYSLKKRKSIKPYSSS